MDLLALQHLYDTTCAQTEPSGPPSPNNRPEIHNNRHQNTPTSHTEISATPPRSKRRRRASASNALLRTGVPPTVVSCTVTEVLLGDCDNVAQKSANVTLQLDFSQFKKDDVPSTAKEEEAAAGALAALTSSPNIQHVVFLGNPHSNKRGLAWVLEHGSWAHVPSLHIKDDTRRSECLQTYNAFESLRRLDLSHSRIFAFSGPPSTHCAANDPPAFADTLRFLNISHSHFIALPSHALQGFTALQDLHVSHNLLTSVGGSLQTALPSSLVTLKLDNNIIRHITQDAFDNLLSLRVLSLASNDIEIPDGLFDRLTALTHLDLSYNPIEDLPNGVFDTLTLLEELQLTDTRIQKLPPRVFHNTRRLKLVRIRNAQLSVLDSDLFLNANQLTEVVFTNNDLTSLPATLFQNHPALFRLFLDDNRIKTIDEALFQHCPSLQHLHLSNNLLTTLPERIFQNNTGLNFLVLTRNKLHSLPPGLFRNVPIVALSIAHNELKEFNHKLPHLSDVDLSFNKLTQQPDMSHFPSLRGLLMNGHTIKDIDLAPFLSNPSMSVLELDALSQDEHPGTSRALLHEEEALNTNLTTLDTLSLENVELSPEVVPALKEAKMSLRRLVLGWPGMHESSVPLQALCNILGANVREFGLVHTAYTNITTCERKDYELVFLQDNTHVTSVTVFDDVAQLNVSGCTELTTLHASVVDILDISKTRIIPSSAFCTIWGQRMVFARDLGLDIKQLTAARVGGLLQHCLNLIDVIDLSGNRALNTYNLLSGAASRVTLLTEQDNLRPIDLVFDFPSRKTIPLLILEDLPIQCNVRLTTEDVRPFDGESMNVDDFNIKPGFFLKCQCARGFRPRGGVCVVDDRALIRIAALSAGGSILFVLVVLLIVWRVRRTLRYQVLLQHDNDVKQLLIDEREQEVLALKKVWEVEFDELQLVKRVAAGAFGTVFMAKWDTLTVAVKVLQHQALEFDETTRFEFEKEVEFLQRTRHPNVVRFFGAGTNPHGSPFIVLEYVPLGSLRNLLAGDLGVVLLQVQAEQQQQQQRQEQASASHEPDMGVVDASEDMLLVTTGLQAQRASIADLLTVWDLKLRLLRDVAAGIAFIHSLGHVHRDIKSGNVLVSSTLRAKITDFGSIRQCLTRADTDARATAMSPLHTADTAFDMQYLQGVGSESMHLSLTAGVGTPMYMAPEVLGGETYDAQADVFSFGVLMWEVATQCDPDLIAQERPNGFRGPLLHTLHALLQDGKRLQYTEGCSAPGWFRRLSAACMHWNPSSRPTFQELRDVKLLQETE